MRNWIHAFAAAALMSLPIAARADEKPARLAAITLENDFFAGYDHHYTNGVQAAFVVSPSTVFAIGQRIYTPTNTDARVPDPADRPYAGWLYAMTDTRLPTRGTIDHLTLSLGVVGPHALGEQYRYEPAHPLGCPIVACDAPADRHASRSGLEDWKQETTARFSIHRFGGDRSYIHKEREALTALIRNHVSVMMGALARSAPMPR